MELNRYKPTKINTDEGYASQIPDMSLRTRNLYPSGFSSLHENLVQSSYARIRYHNKPVY